VSNEIDRRNDSRTKNLPMLIAITGAAGNLGSLLAEHILADGPPSCVLRLLIHRRDVSPSLRKHPRVEVVRCDLGDPSTLVHAFDGVDCVVHFAGVLFRARPARFLPTTNTAYFRNLTDAALAAHVRRIVLISFPHVEGVTTPENPARGRLDGKPESAHARTRLEEEKHLFSLVDSPAIEAISLRVGMVYGRGILMPDVARWLARRWLLAVWREPTWIHLISKADFAAATSNATVLPNVRGIYHLGDEGKQTLQDFLDVATAHWRARKAWRLPLALIYAAACLCELQSFIFGTKAPLTRDFITIGRCSYFGDTVRMRAELLPELKYPTLESGRAIL
jgi:nucleoside-diphosphate-sugar epimerase